MCHGLDHELSNPPCHFVHLPHCWGLAITMRHPLWHPQPLQVLLEIALVEIEVEEPTMRLPAASLGPSPTVPSLKSMKAQRSGTTKGCRSLTCFKENWPVLGPHMEHHLSDEARQAAVGMKIEDLHDALLPLVPSTPAHTSSPPSGSIAYTACRAPLSESRLACPRSSGSLEKLSRTQGLAPA